jgi:LuxR family maltose regulon positive regulatory protein
MLLAEIALHKADTAEWQQAISSMERAVSFPAQNNYIIRSVLDIIRGTLLNELQDHKSIADWLQKGDFSGRRLLPPVAYNAQFVYLSLMMHRGEFARLIGTAQAMVPDGVRTYPFRELLLYLTLAVSHISLGDRTQAAFLVEYAAQRALPDGLIFPIVSYSWLLQGLTDELIEKENPALLDKFNEIRERFLSG